MPPGIDGLPDWAIMLFYAVVALGAAFIFVRSMMNGAKKVKGPGADRALSAVGSMSSYSDRLTNDALIAAIGELHGTIIEFHATVRLMSERLDRDRDERKLREELQQEHDLSDLRRMVAAMKTDQKKP